MERIINADVDIYAEFGVADNATAHDITKRYRQLALKYHPDKNASKEAASTFQYYSTIYTILSDPELRRQYDGLRSQRRRAGRGDISEQISRFQQQLQRQEAIARKANIQRKQHSDADVEVLSMEGLRLRRELQKSLSQGAGYVSYRDLPVSQYTDVFLACSNEVTVRWKCRPEPEAKIDESKLAQIMSVFGPVRSCSIDGNNGRYSHGTVSFEESEHAQKATSHDYKRSADIWNNTPVRKLASLLREVTMASKNKSYPTSVHTKAGLQHFLRELQSRYNQDEESLHHS